MAMHPCVRCGVAVGDSAASCPNCGTAEHKYREEPRNRCQICGELVKQTELVGYQPLGDRGGNSAHENCLSRYFSPPPFRCSDCGSDFTPSGGWREIIRRRPDRAYQGGWPFLSPPCVCPHCHGQNWPKAQGHCNQCGLPIFTWQEMVEDKKARISYHDFCKKASDNHRQRNLDYLASNKRGFWGLFKSE